MFNVLCRMTCFLIVFLKEKKIKQIINGNNHHAPHDILTIKDEKD